MNYVVQDELEEVIRSWKTKVSMELTGNSELLLDIKLLVNSKLLENLLIISQIRFLRVI